MDNINSYIIIVIYPDGTIEKVARDSRNNHIEYMISLINSSVKLKTLIKEKNIYIPIDEEEIKRSQTHDLDEKFAKEGIIVLHNMLVDLNIDWFQSFHISLPSNLTSEQKEIMHNIVSKYDLSESWYGLLQDDELVDIKYDDMLNMISDKVK